MKGFAALISVIIIGAVMMVAGMMVTLTSINEGQMSLSTSRNNGNLSILDSCSEDSLLFINENNTLPAIIATPNGNCTTTVNSHVGTSWDFTVTSPAGDYQRASRLIINRGSNLNIASWQDQ